MSSSLLLCKNKEPFLDQIATCDKKWNLYDRDNQLSGWTKKKLQSTSQSQTCTRKGPKSLFGGLLPVWSTTAFGIPAKSWHLRSLLSKSMRCTENCHICSWYWSTEGIQFSMTTPDHTAHSKCFRTWTNQAMKFSLVCHIHLTSYQLTATCSSILTTFCRENPSTISKRQKMLSKCSSNTKTWIFIQE